MTMPERIVEIGFSGPGTGLALHLDDVARGLLDTNTLAADDLLTDITEFVRDISLQRGSSRVEGPVVRYEAGTATATLKNDDRRFDPTNLSGPYVSAGATEVEPMRPVRFRATWAGVTYDLWRGYVDNWALGYWKKRNYSEVVLTATDGFKVLSDADRAAGSPVGGGEDSGARVHRILDSTDWETADRVIATGDTTLQATTLAGSALTELFLVADTEVGELYVDAAGRVVFRNRHALVTDERSNTSQAIFGDDPDTVAYVDAYEDDYSDIYGVPTYELRYYDVTVEYDAEQLFNDVRIARTGGTQQTAQDATSRTKYLTHSYERTDLLMESDGVALDYANFILQQTKDPELRFSTLVIRPHRDPDNLFPQVLGREIGDRITIKLQPPGGGTITRDVFVRGIRHEIHLDWWETTWTLQAATMWAFLVLDNATLGTLDENALAY